MKFVLFMMFFITPPAVGDQKVWSLQNTATIDFDSFTACDDAIRNKILKSIQSTDTVSLFGWCLPRDIGDAKITADDVRSAGQQYRYVPPSMPPSRR